MSNIRPWFRLSSIARPTSQGSSDPPPPPPQPQPRQTPRRPVIIRTPARQLSPPRQPQPPPPARQQQRPRSPPRQKTPPPPPPSSRGKGRDPPLTPPPQEQSPYHSPPSRHMSPVTPRKATTPPLLPARLLYTPPASPKEVKEAFQPRTQNSPPSPAHSTRSIKSEWETPRRASSPHGELSPYSLPPSRLHSERETTQKNILTAEKTSHLHEPNHHDNNHSQNQNQNQNHNHQGNNTKKSHHKPSFSESENILGTRVITIAGENKGAVMEILRSPRSNKTGSGTHSSKVFNGTEGKGRRLQSSSDEGEGKKKTTKNPNNGNLPMRAFTNSNVQMINNSIVYNSTAIHHDPGVHLKITRKHGSGNGLHVKDYGNNGEYTN